MNKILKSFTILICFIAGLFILVSCSNKKSGIHGELSVECKRTELVVTAEFEKNSKLDNGNASISFKLYNDDDSYNTSLSAVLENGIKASTTFSKLKQNTKYIIRLFVSLDGYEEELDSIEATTKNEGSDAESAISVKTIEDFKNMKNDLSAYYKLESDLDFKDESALSLFTSSGSAFSGTFDGDNHTLKNVKLSAEQYTGLFGYTTNATIKNLKIETLSIEMTESKSSSSIYFGGLVGYGENTAIENVEIKTFDVHITEGKSITSTSAKIYAGGMVGKLLTSEGNSSSIVDSFVEDARVGVGEVKVGTSGLLYIGLFVGQISGKTEVKNCHSTGSMDHLLNANGIVSVGGFIGAISSEMAVSSCYTVCDIRLTRKGNSSELNVGGFIGKNPTDGKCNLKDCLTINDITVLAKEEEADANTEKLGREIYIAGFLGNLTRGSSEGIENCVYAPKANGIKIVGQLLAVQKEKEGEIKYNSCISLTFGNVDVAEAYDPQIRSKMSDIYCLEEKLDLVYTVLVEKTYDLEEGEDKDEVIDQEDRLNEIRNTILDSLNVSSTGKDCLSEALQEVLKNQ